MKLSENFSLLLTHINRKTIVFNFHYLPFKEAIRLPFFLSRNARLRTMKGSVEITGPIRTGMIRIGTEEVGFYDKRHNRPVWENAGHVDFQGVTRIKYGASIIVAEGAKLILGDGFRISSGSHVVCYKAISFGKNCRISWDVQIIDTDFHRVFDQEKKHLNPDSAIQIGDNCWIGNHCLIQKGSTLGNMVVVATNSLVNSTIPDNNVLLAGSPAVIKKTSISWSK